MSKTKLVGLNDGCIFKVSDIFNCFGRVPPLWNKCFSCKEPAVNVVCGNLDQDRPGLEAMSYGDPVDDEIAHALMLDTSTTIALPTCLVHTYGNCPN